MHPEFFESVKDSPLHMVFDVVKPKVCAQLGRIPRAIRWTAFEKANADRLLRVAIPECVLTELIDFTIEAREKGVTEESFAPTIKDAELLTNVAAFAAKV